MSLNLSAEIRGLVDNALANGTPMLIAVVTADGKPRMSFRGSMQSLSDDQLSFWARRLEGATLEGIKVHPDVAVLYRDAPNRMLLQFAGRARVATDPAERDRVYEIAPEIERRADPERKGDGVVIDLDRVEGMLGLGEDGRPKLLRLTRED
ncbi:MAG TPA: pyridoxamine 5'-phosphate oxidase family protein [Caulobacteraceae bacterium]|nr:pyridoxamine 5'-phosphate oxidase family protein [Caulobacteraceae bacterium]